MNIGILGTSEIAFRRFLPALEKFPQITYAGVATWTTEKAKSFVDTFGGKIYEGYDALLADRNIEAVYVPLPPALHFEWGKKVLQAGKHLLMEKPFTTKLKNTNELLSLANERGLTIHENYMFLYHRQLAKIKELILSGDLGDVRLYRMSFGFPKRAENDFRYNRGLGGGALLDCGGYPVRLALEMLGNGARVAQARLCQPDGYEVDLYGSAVLENEDGICAQLSFGMDNAYQCQLEVWGSKATLIAPRIFTAGADMRIKLVERTSYNESIIELQEDDQFLHSIEQFYNAVQDSVINTDKIALQAKIMDEIRAVGEV